MTTSQSKRARYTVPVYRIELVQTNSVLSRCQWYANQPSHVARLFREVVGNADREHMVAFFLDPQHRVLGIHVAAVGEVNAVHCTPSSVFKGAMLGNAVSVVLAHNHPAGDPDPSRLDVEFTHQMELAGAMLGIVVLDHVVVGARSSISLRETDRMLMPDEPSTVSDDELDARLRRMRSWQEDSANSNSGRCSGACKETPHAK